jgi:hypothetical protein
MDAQTRNTSTATLRALVAVTVVGAAGSLLMSIAHAGVEIPLFSALGPSGNRAIPPAAAGFAVGATLYAVTALGLARARSWAWAVGLVVNGLTLVSAAYPYRGLGSLAGIAVAVVSLGLLLARPVRTVLLGDR